MYRKFKWHPFIRSTRHLSLSLVTEATCPLHSGTMPSTSSCLMIVTQSCSCHARWVGEMGWQHQPHSLIHILSQAGGVGLNLTRANRVVSKQFICFTPYKSLPQRIDFFGFRLVRRGRRSGIWQNTSAGTEEKCRDQPSCYQKYCWGQDSRPPSKEAKPCRRIPGWEQTEKVRTSVCSRTCKL